MSARTKILSNVAMLWLLAICGMTRAQSVWPLTKLQELSGEDRITRSNLTQEEKTALRSALNPAFNKFVKEDPTFIPSETFNNLRVRQISLQDHSANSYFVQPSGYILCGATGNCPIWIFDHEMHLLLRLNMVQSFVVTDQSSHGLFDVVVASHSSATEHGLRRLRFDGSRYRLIQCANVSNGAFGRTYKKPRFTPESCVGFN
jgi:hypothetical protein